MNTRQRFTSLYVYATEANARNNTNGTEYTSGIVDGSQRYEHTSLSSLPGFGEANAAMYECEISETTDLTGKWIRVKYSYYATDSATTLTDKWFFLGKVDSCKYDKQKLTRKLIAYDKLYELRNVDISSWWLTYWASASGNVYARTLLVDACTQFGVAQAFASSLRNNFTVYKAAQNGRNLGGCTFADLLRYIGEITGSLFWINGSGNLVYSYLMEQTPTDISNNIDTTETEIADTDLAGYGTMMAYDGADIIYTGGSGSPVYTISDNVLLYGRSTANIVSLLDTTRGYLAYIVGLRPATIPLIVAEESFLAVGRAYVTFPDGSDARTCLITSVECSGSQLIDMTVTCTGDMVTGTQYNQAMSKAANDIQDIGVQLTYKVNADGVIEAVNAEASDTIKIQARALDINGIVTANNNFKINADGSMETIAGKIGGWTIDSDKLSNSGTGGYVSLDAPNGSATSGASAVAIHDYFNENFLYLNYDGSLRSYWNNVGIESDEVKLDDGNIYVERKYYKDAGDSSSEWRRGETLIDGSEVEVLNSKRDNTESRDLPLHRSLVEAYPTFADVGSESHTSSADSSAWLGTSAGKAYLTLNGDTVDFKVNDRDMFNEFKAHTQYFATAIPANANLKTNTYLNAGRYVCYQNATAATLSNCPVSTAFNMDVDYPISTFNTLPSTWAYIQRTITAISGEVWFQYIYLDGNGDLTWYDWTPLRSGTTNGNVVRQIETTENSIYEILFSESTQDGVSHFERTRKYQGLRFNPSNAQFNVRRIHSGTTSQIGSIVLGNATGNGSQGASHGTIYVYGKGTKYARFADENSLLTADRLYELPNKDGVLAILESDTLDVGNRGIQITGADVGRSVSVRTKAGGIAYLTYFANGNHGVYSSGYESDIADSTTYTASNKWIIRRNSGGNVFVDEWASIGSASKPIYFSSSGRPVEGNEVVSTSKTAASGGTDLSLVTTGEKYTWNSKTSNTGTVTSVAVSGSKGISISGSPVTTSGTVTVSVDTASGTATRNTTNTSSGTLTYVRYGKVVYIYGEFSLSTTATDKTVFTGLPAPEKANCYVTSLGPTASDGGSVFKINSSGQMLTALRAAKSGNNYISATYIADY